MKHFYTFLVAVLFTSFGFGQIISQYVEANSGSNPKGIEIWNNTGSTLDFATNNLVIEKGTNGATPSTDFTISSGTLASGAVLVIGTSDMETVTLANGSAFYLKAFTFNGDDALVVKYGGAITDMFGTAGTDPGSSWSGSGVSTANQNIGLINSITTGDLDGWTDPSTRFSTVNTNPSGTDGDEGFGIAPSAPSADTSVQFASASTTVLEDVGTIDLTFEITNEDATNATSFDVVLTTGDAADINGYTTQTVTFPAGSSTNETLTITITDDAVFEGDETLTFTITGVTGGNNATLGTQSTFDLTIEDNESSPAITIVIEDFDGTYPNWNNDIESQLFVDPTSSNEGLFIQAASSNNANFSGNTAFGRDLAGESGEPTLSPYTFTFDDVDVSDYTSITVNFDYHAFANAETGDYEIVIDGVGQGSVEYFNDPDSSPGVNGTISIPVADGTSTVGLILTGTLNGGSDVIEFDNFKVEGIYNGYAYSDGSWYPTNPDGTTGASNAIVADGVAVLNSDVSLNDVVVYPGAGLDVESGNTLTVNSLTLESTSTTYSSFILDGAITGTVTYNRFVNSNDTVNGNDLISAPVSGQAFNAFISNNTNILANPSGTNVLFGGFDNDNATDPFELWDETDTTPLTAGVGYRSGIDPVAGSNLVSFEGTVNNSLVEVAINQGSASILNLVGNPFPSYLDAQAFLTQNAALLDPSAVVIYGYNDSTNGTSADDYTIISAIENNTLNIAPGQGFFVASNVAGGNLQFTTNTPDMRITSTDDDFIAGRAAITNVNINLSNATDNFITKVYFTAASTLGLDPGYDASLLGGVAPAFSLFSHLVEENMDVPFATQAIGKTDYNDTTIALGVNANMGEQLTFSIAENTLPTSIEVYLDDTLTSTSTLLNTSDYVLTPSEDLNGTGRFYLRFSNSALSTADAIFDGISIYTNQTNKTISIAGQLTEGTYANVYDIQGRLVTAKALESNTTLQTIDASNLHTGVYIVKLVNGNATKTEKIILK